MAQISKRPMWGSVLTRSGQGTSCVARESGSVKGGNLREKKVLLGANMVASTITLVEASCPQMAVLRDGGSVGGTEHRRWSPPARPLLVS